MTVLRLAAPLFRLAMEHITADLRGLRLCVSGGDRADANAVRTALRALPGCRIVNGYGPTETTVYACWQVLDGPDGWDSGWRDVPIGHPFAGATAHVLRPDRTPAAPGEEGELCIGGPGVARGYRGRPQQTAERFIPEPGRPDRTAYLTGDRVRLLPDGSLAFLGRFDDQVKIRGHRVEPAETERALLAHPAVRAAVAVPHGAAVSRRLAAYVVLAPGAAFAGDDHAAQAALTAHAARILPPRRFRPPSRSFRRSRPPPTANRTADCSPHGPTGRSPAAARPTAPPDPAPVRPARMPPPPIRAWWTGARWTGARWTSPGTGRLSSAGASARTPTSSPPAATHCPPWRSWPGWNATTASPSPSPTSSGPRRSGLWRPARRPPPPAPRTPPQPPPPSRRHPRPGTPCGCRCRPASRGSGSNRRPPETQDATSSDAATWSGDRCTSRGCAPR